jgi:1-aminocyclopropane-1-carboxylate deaminase
MAIIDERLAVIQPISKFWYESKVAGLDMLRLDRLHPVISGNKWYKLRLNLAYAADHGFRTIVTFGGAYSNHLIATACAAQQFGLKSVGIVRGQHATLSTTLLQCQENGMELIFVTHEDYSQRHQPEWAQSLVAHFDEILIIPEGGANERGRLGAGLITRFINNTYSHVILSVGTGTTLAGLREKLNPEQYVIGFVPMKQSQEQHQYISDHLSPGKENTWTLVNDTHFGGFGKTNDELVRFMNDFYADNKIPLDIVYTSKMMYQLQQMLSDNYFNSCDRILCIHTGGLQGNSSVQSSLKY